MSEKTTDGVEKEYVLPEPSKEIPILAYQHPEHGGDGINSDSGSTQELPEYAMIELNGTLIPPIEFPPGETCRKVFGEDRRIELGKFFRKGPNKTPTMILGNHELKGEVVSLKTPFCLMEKKYDETVKPKQIQAYQIKGIVKEKFLFKNYPKAIMR